METAQNKLTCLSCYFWERTHCRYGDKGWPDRLLTECAWADYEPGVDETELRANDD